jgi:hypothetical protein
VIIDRVVLKTYINAFILMYRIRAI